MQNELLIRAADLDDINTIGFLAHETWPTAYGATHSQEQISYMLNLFYAPKALATQMNTDKHRFLLAELDDEAVGFASFSAIDGEGTYKLHKLYVLPSLQGKGVGRLLLEFICDELKHLKASALRLNVNRLNAARHFYEKLGFEVIKEEVNDIGRGFVMDDYVMEKKF